MNTFRGALVVLGRHDGAWPRRLDAMLGGVLAGDAVTGVALVGAVANWLDPQGEPAYLLRHALGTVGEQLRDARGGTRLELIVATHTAMAVSALFDCMWRTVGHRYRPMSHAEIRARSGDTDEAVLRELYDAEVPAPSVTRDVTENIDLLKTWATRTFLTICRFLDIEADDSRDRREFVDAFVLRYRADYAELATVIPEFLIWTDVGERTAYDTPTLERFVALLSVTAGGRPVRDLRALLAEVNAAEVKRPVIDLDTYVAHVVFPAVRDIFLTPWFRVTVADRGVFLAHERWWATMTAGRGDLDRVLARYLTTPGSATLPLLVLGEPGGGKSLLMKVLAARLPPEMYTVVRVPLRSVDPESTVVQQIQQALAVSTNGRGDWFELANTSDDTVRVVLLDGLDDLPQTGRAGRSAYLAEVAEFQRVEAAMGRPVAAVVTARTIVADRFRVPDGTPVIKLDGFDEAQVRTWIQIWNDANSGSGVGPMTAGAALAHPELARQPLLLLMLTLYFATTGRKTPGGAPPKAELYGGVLDAFVRREVTKSVVHPLPDEELASAVRVQLYRLSIAALGMFNRGRGSITEAELAADLAALDDGSVRAQQLLGQFFFVHAVEPASEVTQQRAYEFLHAMFAEYLVAEFVAEQLADIAEATFDQRRRGVVDDDLLFAALSHRNLVDVRTVVAFLSELLATRSDDSRSRFTTLLDLVIASHKQKPYSQYRGYRPIPPDIVHAHVVYEENLVLLRDLVATDEQADVTVLSPDNDARPDESLDGSGDTAAPEPDDTAPTTVEPGERTHAGFAADVAEGPDRLGITGEVNTLCDVILAKEVSPPLSVGLFGDWGTGKSFFMAQMRERIGELAAASAQAGLEGDESALCANVCQIEFNAWHFLDADLWASLAATIFDRLAAADPATVSGDVLRDLPSVQRMRTELVERRERTKHLLDNANDELEEQGPIGVRDVLTTGHPVVAADMGTAAQQVDKALIAAGVDAAKVRQLNLRAMTDSVGSLSRNLVFIFQKTKWTIRLTILAAVLLFVGGPVLATILLKDWLGWLTTSVSSIVAFGIAALLIAKPHLDRANQAFATARSFVDDVDQRRRAPVEARRESLVLRMADIEKEILHLDTRIQELNQANSLSAFAIERHRDDRYRRHEGVVATLRRDLEEMSRRLLSGDRARTADLERIVLYVDDLDRCPADRVVEVLQAIHLLLAFPLFVVVVGVDSRWLLNSLDQLLNTAEDESSTSQNYLEKIFQISICLRPMSATGYAALVEATAGRIPEVAAGPVRHTTAIPALVNSVDDGSSSARNISGHAVLPTDHVTTAVDAEFPVQDDVPMAPATPSGTPTPSTQALSARHPAATPARRVRYHAGQAAVAYLAFDSHQPTLAVIDTTGAVVRRDLRSGDVLLTAPTVNRELTAVHPVSEGRVLLVGPFGQHVAVLVDLADGRVTHEIASTLPGPVTAVVSADSTDMVLSWPDAGDGPQRFLANWTDHALRDHARPAATDVLALSRDWQVERVGDRTVVRNSGSEMIAVPGARPAMARLDPAGARLGIVDADGLVRVWRLTDSTDSRGTPLPTTAATLHFGPHDQVATTHGSQVVVWNSISGHPLAELTADTPVTAVAFASDGGRLATGTTTGSVEVWSLRAPRSNTDLTASALRIGPEERAMIVAVRPFIGTPRLAKRLINTYRLLRSSLASDELERLMSGDHKVVLILLALLLGEPDRAHGILRALVSDTTLPATFTTMIRRFGRAVREPRRRVAGPRVATAPGPFESAVARVVADTEAPDDTESYRRWADVVSRYSFRLLDAEPR